MRDAANIADPRRHDLDALRAVAMLLGIGLHAALSLGGSPWIVTDVQTNGAFALFVHAVHGFRMPLFFLLSGFFTSMLWRRRGLRALLWHRFRRVFLPCMLGLVTIVPAVFVVVGLAASAGPLEESQLASVENDDLWSAARAGDTDAVSRQLAAGVDVDARSPDGTSALTTAAAYGRVDAVKLLIEKGADLDAGNSDGSTALHAAAFLGEAEVVRELLESGADVNVRNNRGERPLESANADWGITEFIAGLLQIELDREQVEAGRAEAIRLLREYGADSPAATEHFGMSAVIEGVRGLALLLIYLPVFHHLWFLWFLCWLVAGFGIYAWFADRRGWKGPATWLIASPARFLWLIPVTLIPQALMGRVLPTFGPDTSIGLLPAPQILLYYAIFFFYGALYFDCGDVEGRLGRWWPITLPFGLLVLFPIALEFTLGPFGFRDDLASAALHRPIAVLLQALYAWILTFACIGMFRSIFSRESRVMRYLSDSSYWLYVAHLPLIILAQLAVRSWPLSATVKFVLICGVVSGVLLLTYQTMVRYTWLGTLLNGPRIRRSSVVGFRSDAARTTGDLEGGENLRERVKPLDRR